jgi:hypothetical protein
LDAEGFEEAPDVSRNVLVALDPAVDEQGWGRKIPSEPGSRRVQVFTAGFRAVGARAKTATGSRGAGATIASTCSRAGVIIRHIVPNPWEVNTIVTSGEGKSESGSVSSASQHIIF